MRAAAWLGVLGACGRIDFDPRTDGGTEIDAPGTCLSDDFQGADPGWILGAPWNTLPASGPDGSTSFDAPGGLSFKSLTNPRIAAVTSAHIAVDFSIGSGAAGDFNIYFVDPGAVVGNAGTHDYVVGLFPSGSDSDPDTIRLQNPVPGSATLASHPSTVAADAWHHVDAVFRVDGSISVQLDGAPHMDSPADAVIARPLDVYIAFWGPGRIDNVVIDCTR